MEKIKHIPHFGEVGKLKKKYGYIIMMIRQDR
jgi:hypothetical protein